MLSKLFFGLYELEKDGVAVWTAKLHAFSTTKVNPSVSTTLTLAPFCIVSPDVFAENSSLFTNTVPVDRVMSDVACPVEPTSFFLILSEVTLEGAVV